MNLVAIRALHTTVSELSHSKGNCFHCLRTNMAVPFAQFFPPSTTKSVRTCRSAGLLLWVMPDQSENGTRAYLLGSKDSADPYKTR